MTTPNVSVSVNRTGLGVSPFAGGDILAVIGPATAGQFNKPLPMGSSSSIRETYGRGPLPQLATYIREAKIRDLPLGRTIVCVRCATSTPGSVGDLDVADFAGTAEPVKGVTTSDDDYQLRILFDVGGTLKTSGIVYRVSKNDGLNYGPKMALGTGHTITIPDSGGLTITLEPPEAELVALVNDLRTDMLAHFALTSGSVHGAADTTSDDGVGSAATDKASAIALVNQIRTAYAAHRVLTAGGVHGAADSTNAVTLAAATNAHEAVDLANDLKSKYNAHRVLTSGSVHGAADSTNVTNAANAIHGTVVAGDELAAEASSPMPSDEDLDEALAALQATKMRWDLAAVATPVSTSDEVSVLTDRISTWETAKRFRPILASFRFRAAGETAADYRIALKALFDAVNRDGLYVGYDAALTRSRIDGTARYRRPAIWGVAAKAVAARPGEDIAYVDKGLGVVPDVDITDDNGNDLFHNEDTDPGPDDDRAVTLRTIPDYEGTFITNPKSLAQPGTDLFLLQYYRAIAKAVRTVVYTLTGLLSVALAPDQKTGKLASQEIEDLRTNVLAALERDVIAEGWAVAADVAIDASVNFKTSPIIPVDVSIIPFLYAKHFSVRIGLRNPFAAQTA
jgi:hypothetical protein